MPAKRSHTSRARVACSTQRHTLTRESGSTSSASAERLRQSRWVSRHRLGASAEEVSTTQLSNGSISRTPEGASGATSSRRRRSPACSTSLRSLVWSSFIAGRRRRSSSVSQLNGSAPGPCRRKMSTMFSVVLTMGVLLSGKSSTRASSSRGTNGTCFGVPLPWLDGTRPPERRLAGAAGDAGRRP